MGSLSIFLYSVLIILGVNFNSVSTAFNRSLVEHYTYSSQDGLLLSIQQRKKFNNVIVIQDPQHFITGLSEKFFINGLPPKKNKAESITNLVITNCYISTMMPAFEYMSAHQSIVFESINITKASVNPTEIKEFINFYKDFLRYTTLSSVPFEFKVSYDLSDINKLVLGQ